MKKARTILLIVSIVVIAFGTAGLIVTSNREIDREGVDMMTDYRDEWQRILWAAEGTWEISDQDRAKWPDIDKLVREARMDPDVREKIKNDYLPWTEKELDNEWDQYNDEKRGKNNGVNNGTYVIAVGVLLFAAWAIWTRRTVRKSSPAV